MSADTCVLCCRSRLPSTAPDCPKMTSSQVKVQQHGTALKGQGRVVNRLKSCIVEISTVCYNLCFVRHAVSASTVYSDCSMSLNVGAWNVFSHIWYIFNVDVSIVCFECSTSWNKSALTVYFGFCIFLSSCFRCFECGTLWNQD